jgi:eukaryotic-like serine/threonine-protein kinase
MTIERAHLHGLLHLHLLPDDAARRATWRQSMATLAALLSSRAAPVPLEGCEPDALLAGTREAMKAGLFDDLSWLSPPSAAAAVYELAAALPPSDVKRELGRRVLLDLHGGNAATFVALATQLALGSSRTLSGTPIRARVALALDLPLGLGARADALALALISRRELSREWLAQPATGALPGRRLAARLLERAAREAMLRAAQGDDSGLHVFETPAVRQPWERLLADRESLVWRHVAVARGLLAGAIPELGEALERHVDPQLTPTEWRRAAASLAAHIAIDPDGAAERCVRLLGSEVLQRDRGVAGAMILGLPRAVEAQPEAAERLLAEIVPVGGVDAAEALVDLLRERVASGFAHEAVRAAIRRLRDDRGPAHGTDDGRAALLDALLAELSGETAGATSLHAQVASALATFAEQGAAASHATAKDILASVEARVLQIETGDDLDAADRRATFQALREVGAVLFETDTLANLLSLAPRIEATASDAHRLGDLFERVTDWMVLREYEPLQSASGLAHLTYRMRRLRTMLHLVDADGPHVEARADLLRRRRFLTAQILLHRARDDVQTPLRRALCAATARACDALVREEMGELSDVLLTVGSFVTDAEDLCTLSEASMIPELEGVLLAYGQLQRTVASAPRSGRGVRAGLQDLARLARELPVARSPRVEALRSSLLSVERALEAIAAAPSLKALAAGREERCLPALAEAVQSLAELCMGARRRLQIVDGAGELASAPAIRLLDVCLEKALRGDPGPIADALGDAASVLGAELPGPIADLILLALERVWQLPADAPDAPLPAPFHASAQRRAPLPPWVPPSRTLGGFYVLGPIGSGGGGSVFVARRVHERQDPTAERFALKVPEYDGTAARTLSEAEFLQLFREEASALLSLPQHPHIARFVTFDAGSRPKPILVMELVEGPTLDSLLERRDMTVAGALYVLDGLLAGLEAMHAVGIAHLDVKPGNVVMRSADGGPGATIPVAMGPVLVDFGLAGRHLRPGCATAHYGAPEVWGAAPATDPRPADVYAFGCLAFEALTGHTLFTGPHEMAVITSHLSHDGTPPALAALAEDSRTSAVAEWLARALRQAPAARASAADLRRALAALRPSIETQAWPIGP